MKAVLHKLVRLDAKLENIELRLDKIECWMDDQNRVKENTPFVISSHGVDVTGFCPLCTPPADGAKPISVYRHLIRHRPHHPLDDTKVRVITTLGLDVCRCGSICKSLKDHYVRTECKKEAWGLAKRVYGKKIVPTRAQFMDYKVLRDICFQDDSKARKRKRKGTEDLEENEVESNNKSKKKGNSKKSDSKSKVRTKQKQQQQSKRKKISKSKESESDMESEEDEEDDTEEEDDVTGQPLKAIENIPKRVTRSNKGKQQQQKLRKGKKSHSESDKENQDEEDNEEEDDEEEDEVTQEEVTKVLTRSKKRKQQQQKLRKGKESHSEPDEENQEEEGEEDNEEEEEEEEPDENESNTFPDEIPRTQHKPTADDDVTQPGIVVPPTQLQLTPKTLKNRSLNRHKGKTPQGLKTP